MRIRSLLSAVLSFMATSVLCAQQTQPRVELFSPRGTAKGVRQVRARFSEPIVPFGDPRSVASPFEIACPAKGSEHWADSRNWIFDFETDLEAGIRCEFRLRAGLKTLSGTNVGGTRAFSFSTGGPAITASTPWEGSEQIEEEQIFLLALDAAPEEASVLSNVGFAVEGIASRVGVRIVQGQDRDEIIAARYPFARRRPPHLLLIRATQRFPNGAKVSLIWGRGVQSASGVANAQDQVLPYKVREPFRARFECQRENADAQCVPITPMRLDFSSPVSRRDIVRALLKGPAGQEWKPEFESQDNEEGEEAAGYTHTAIFRGPFPENSAFTLEIPEGILDDSGRSLTNASSFPLTVRTDEFPPLAKFSADFGILELKGDPLLPVTLRNVEPTVAGRVLDVVEGQVNLEEPPKAENEPGLTGTMQGRVLKIPGDRPSQMLEWIDRLSRRGWQDRGKSVFGPATSGRARRISIPKLNGPKAFEVVGIPLRTPGFYVVEIESEILGTHLLGAPKPMYVATSALVTNMAVHFKWGHDSSVAWVTALDKGKPVAGAEVIVRNCEGREVYRGRTDSDGLVRTDKLPSRASARSCNDNGYRSGLVVTAQLGDDVTFTHTDWKEGIEPWRFRLPVEYREALLTAHTIFDRQLFRQGETVHMKHLLRKRGSGGFSLASGAEYPLLSVRHWGSDQEYEIPLKWEGGSAESEWQIPAAAKLGQYGVSLKDRSGTSIAAGVFRVEDYRVPLMRAILRPPSSPLVTPSAVPLDLTITYLAGGAAANLPVRLRHQVVPRYYSPVQDFDGFNFGNGRVQEGVFRGEPEEEEERQGQELHSRDLTLDESGSLRAVVSDLPRIGVPMDLHAEVEYRDPNGEVQTVSSRVPLWPTDRLVGIRPESWTLSQDAIRLKAAVVDLSGKPVAGSAVRVEIYESRYLSHRKRLTGGFYAYEHSTRVRKIGTLCEGKTDKRGLFACEKPSAVSGRVILQAVAVDSAGRETVAQAETWVAGKDEWWFRAQDDDRMDLLAETRRYEPGEKARLQVRMPFREATALVTVEREGVIEAFVRRLSGKKPVVELPVRPGWAPNVFISVFAVRGRVRGVRPTATVDLGRPAFKLGVTELKVGWHPYELRVRVESDRPVYRVRERAKVTVSVTTSEGKTPPPGTEVALAAVDEGLLELMPNDSWNLLQAMMGQRSYGVETSTAQMHVVGKRHFGLKALPQGGGGGRQMTRELFDTLLLWRGRVVLDTQGRATVEVPLNDSITSFRIAAVATAGADRFGTGFAFIRSTQDLMLFSGIPPLARQGDRVREEFTVRNASERPLQVRVAGRIQGAGTTLPPLSVALAPGESRLLEWDVAIPTATVTSLKYEIEADAGGETRDRLSVEQKISPAVPVRTLQATLTRVDSPVRSEVAIPADALREAGGVEVTFRPTLLAGLEGVAGYMSSYPYTCLEQLVSRAVALRNPSEWDAVMKRLPAYLDSDGLAKYFHSMRLGSEVLTAYLLAISHEAGRQIPDGPRQQMLKGLRGFVDGKVIRHSALPTADLSIRKLAAVEALTRYGATDPALLSSVTIEPNRWPTSAVIDWLQVLRRIPNLRDRAARLDTVDQILRSRLNFQGTTMAFSTEGSDNCWWLMASADVNALRLLLAQLESPPWREDMPRLVRGALGRMRRGHWGTTVANAWGTLAVDKFARLFESTPVSGSSIAELAGARQSVDWSTSRGGGTLSFRWPEAESTLLLSNAGTGAPWATVQSRAALPLREPLSSGFTIRKTLVGVVQKEPDGWNRGDIVRVRLELESQADMTWVVVSDPIPAGASVLGSGLGRDSALATSGERSEGWVWPAFEERSFEGYRCYYEFVPKGRWTVEYTVRLNSSGELSLPPTRVEAMYSPEMFGEIPNAAFRVK